MGQKYPYDAVIKGTNERITVVTHPRADGLVMCSHPTMGTFWKNFQDVEEIEPMYLTEEERKYVAERLRFRNYHGEDDAQKAMGFDLYCRFKEGQS